MNTARDIVITIAGKSATEPAVNKSLGDMRKLEGGVKSIGRELRTLRSLGGFAIGARMFSGLIGDLDQVKERLGGQMGDDVAKMSESFDKLRESVQDFADTLVGKAAPAMTKLAGVWQGLIDAMPRSGTTGKQATFELNAAREALAAKGSSLEDQLKLHERRADAARELIFDAVKHRNEHMTERQNMETLWGPRITEWLRESGFGSKLDQIDKQQARGEKALADTLAAIEDVKVAMGFRVPKRDIAAEQRQKWGDNIPNLVIKGFDDPTVKIDIAEGIDEVLKQDREQLKRDVDEQNKVRQELWGRSKVGMVPELQLESARFLTRGTGVATDPVVNELQKNKRELSKIAKSAERQAVAAEELAKKWGIKGNVFRRP